MRRNYLDNPYKILFICLGNICRSPAAQGIMESMIAERGLQDKIKVDSAGTYGGHSGSLPDSRMRVHARRRGYELTHRSRQATWEDYGAFDKIVVMEKSNIYSLQPLFGLVGDDKIVEIGRYIRMNPHYDHVPDPYYDGDEGFELVLDLLEDACGALLDDVCRQMNEA